MKFSDALPYSIDMVIPGYERSYPRGIFKTLSFSDQDSKNWYYQFADVLEGAIGKRFLPLYRMGDGEYELCVGYRFRLRMEGEPLWRYWSRLVKILGLRFLRWRPWKGLDLNPGKGFNWQSGSYSQAETNQFRYRFTSQVRQIAHEGILSLVFSYRKTQFAQQYFLPMTQWFQKNNIPLHAKNYYPVYYVYALLNGPQRHRFFKGRSILIITHLPTEKKAAIVKSLLREGVKKIQFISISPNRSMYDVIDLEKIERPIDLVLVGAGVGACNILLQLRPLGTLAMDVGYVIECLANPERKKQRTFCWPDDERDGNFEPL
jgi:hypothetical protein